MVKEIVETMRGCQTDAKHKSEGSLILSYDWSASLSLFSDWLRASGQSGITRNCCFTLCRDWVKAAASSDMILGTNLNRKEEEWENLRGAGDVKWCHDMNRKYKNRRTCECQGVVQSPNSDHRNNGHEFNLTIACTCCCFHDLVSNIAIDGSGIFAAVDLIEFLTLIGTWHDIDISTIFLRQSLIGQ